MPGLATHLATHPGRGWRAPGTRPDDTRSYCLLLLVAFDQSLDAGGGYVTAEAKTYKAQVQKLALVAGVRKPIAGRVRVDFTLYPDRPQDWQKRIRKDGAAWDDSVMSLDQDNAQKVVLDSLKNVVFQDDAWMREIHARRAEPDGFGVRLMVVVTPLAVDQPQPDLFGATAQERKA